MTRSINFTEQAWREQQEKVERWQRGSEYVDTDAVGTNACKATVSTVQRPNVSFDAGIKQPAQQTHYAVASLCRAHKLPEPVPEYHFHPQRRWRFDFAWPTRMVALEIEGGIWTEGRHTRGSGALADLEKYSEAAIAGWRIIYCTPGDMTTTGIERIRRAIG